MGQQYLCLVMSKILKSGCYIGISDVVISYKGTMNLRQLVYQAILRMFFRALIFWRIRFLKKLKMRTIEEKKDTELFLHVWFSKSNFDADRWCWKNVECFWSHRSRKEGLDNAGWSGRSYIVLLVVLVLNVDDRQMNGLSMLATMFSRLDVPNCDLVFLRLSSSSLRQDDTEDIFLSLFIVETEA